MVYACFHEVGVEDGRQQIGRDDPKKFLRLPRNERPKEGNEQPDPQEQGKETTGVTKKGVRVKVWPRSLVCQSFLDEIDHGNAFFIIGAWIVTEDIFERKLHKEPENDLSNAVEKEEAVMLPYLPRPKGCERFGGSVQGQGKEGDGDETSRFPIDRSYSEQEVEPYVTTA